MKQLPEGSKDCQEHTLANSKMSKEEQRYKNNSRTTRQRWTKIQNQSRGIHEYHGVTIDVKPVRRRRL